MNINTLLTKKLMANILLISVMTILVFLARPLASRGLGKQHIGISYMTMNNDFYNSLNDELEQEINVRGDIAIIRDAGLDINRQIEQVKSFIEEEVDAIMINPVDGDDEKLLTLLHQARDKGIAVIVFDSQLQEDDLANTTILSDNYQAGVLNAEEMMAKLDKAKILLLEHHQALSSRDRINGFLDTIEGKESYQIVERAEVYGQTEITMNTVSQLLQDGLDVDVIISLNDQAALGALAAIKEQDISDDIYIYSVDGSPEVKTLLANTNDVQTTVAQSVLLMSQESITALYQILDDQSVKEKILIPVTLINKDNIKQYDLTRWQ